jgi:hypothetical protein
MGWDLHLGCQVGKRLVLLLLLGGVEWVGGLEVRGEALVGGALCG